MASKRMPEVNKVLPISSMVTVRVDEAEVVSYSGLQKNRVSIDVIGSLTMIAQYFRKPL